MKKKMGCSIMMFCLAASLTACGGEQAPAVKDTQEAAFAEPADEVDVDLTQLSNTMVYSEVYNMMVTPEDYIGKKVKMKGQCAVYQNPSSENCYYAVIIADATACCSQGLEFVLTDDPDGPAGYPEQGTEITVTGEFETYQEGDSTYCHLIHAKIV